MHFGLRRAAAFVSSPIHSWRLKNIVTLKSGSLITIISMAPFDGSHNYTSSFVSMIVSDKRDRPIGRKSGFFHAPFYTTNIFALFLSQPSQFRGSGGVNRFWQESSVCTVRALQADGRTDAKVIAVAERWRRNARQLLKDSLYWAHKSFSDCRDIITQNMFG